MSKKRDRYVSWMDGHPGIWQSGLVRCVDGVERMHIASMTVFTAWGHARNLMDRMLRFHYLLLIDELLLGPVKPPGYAASIIQIKPKTCVMSLCAFVRHSSGAGTVHVVLTEPNVQDYKPSTFFFEPRVFYAREVKDHCLRTSDN